MIRLRNRRLRALTSGVVTALMMGVGVTVPLLEEQDLAASAVIEQEHAPGTCPSAHDHTVCTQVGANLAQPGTRPSQEAVRPGESRAVPADAWIARADLLDEGHPARGPPLA